MCTVRMYVSKRLVQDLPLGRILEERRRRRGAASKETRDGGLD